MSQVLIDTNIWSTFLRRKNSEDQKLRDNIEMLLKENRISLIGPIRQEILTRIRDHNKFLILKEYFEAFEDDQITTETYEKAAQIANDCLKRGIAISAVDATIVSVVVTNGFEIYTKDKDFMRYKTVVPFIEYQER
jgi:predicted nucleic acid-binding protein